MSSVQRTSQSTFVQLCKVLDFNQANGLVTSPSDTEDDHVWQATNETQKKLKINAIFFLKAVSRVFPHPSSISD